MICPKCNNEVSEKDKVCPHCKKVLLLECPICKKLNRSLLCDGCGFIIASRCHDCGKMNPTIAEKCSACGLDTYVSIAMNEAETEDYGCIAITFPNLQMLKSVLKKKQEYQKFFLLLKNYIFTYAKRNEIRAQLIDDIFVLKCYKEMTTFSSVNKAVKSAIELMEKMGEVSFKLKTKKNFKLACKMTILKRSIENERASYNTGLNLKLLDDKTGEDYFSGLQIITDQYVNSMISRQYKQEVIYSSQINNEFIEFFEFPIRDNITPRYEEEINIKQNILTRPKPIPVMPNVNQDDDNQAPDKSAVINIETNCKFTTVEGIDVTKKLQELLVKKSFVALKSKQDQQLDSKDIYNTLTGTNKKVINVACLDGFRYSPYAFFSQLVASYLKYDIKMGELTEPQKAELKKIDNKDLLYNLLTHKKNNKSPKKMQASYFKLFKKFLQSLDDTIIFVENVDLIDETSMLILNDVINDYSKYDISFVTTAPDSYYVHKEISELLYFDDYTEIRIVRTPVERLLDSITEDVSEVENSYYFSKIKQQHNGGYMHFVHVLNYLRDMNIFISHNGKFLLNSGKTVIYPATLEQLITKKFELLSESESYVLAYSVYLGASIDKQILHDLKIEDVDGTIESLSQKGFVFVNGNIVNISNFRLIKSCASEFLSDEINLMISKNIKENLTEESYKIVQKYELLSADKLVIYDLCNDSINNGDFNAYLSNCKRFLNYTYKIADEDLSEDILAARNEIYSTLSQYINLYPSDKIYIIAKAILEEAMAKKDDVKIVNVSKLMLESALMGENYQMAQQSLHRILVRLLNPNFSKHTNSFVLRQFIYSCISVKLLFYIGNFKACISTLDRIIEGMRSNVHFLNKIRSGSRIKNIFSAYFMSVIIFGVISRMILNRDDIEEFTTGLEQWLDVKIEWKPLALEFNKMFHNQPFTAQGFNVETDVSSNLILGFLIAYKYMEKDYNIFAQSIYKLKIYAKKYKETFVNMLCDLLIGYSYQRLGEVDKAKLIFTDVMSVSQKSGMKFVTMIATLFIANLRYTLGEYDVAMKLVENNLATIVALDCDESFVSIMNAITQVNIIIAQNKLDTDISPIVEKINDSCERYNLNHLKSLMVDSKPYIDAYNKKTSEVIEEVEAEEQVVEEQE